MYFREGLFSKGGGGYHREYCDSKMVPLIFGRDFASENRDFAPENAEGF